MRRFIEQDAQRTVATWKKIERCIELHVLPELGNRPIREVRRAEIHELLDDLVAQGRVGTAREVRKHLSRLFNWALDREIIPDDDVVCDRSLDSTRFRSDFGYTPPTWDAMLDELSETIKARPQ